MSIFSYKNIKQSSTTAMPGYDRDYDREYEGDYDTEGHGEILRSARAADRAFSASMPSAVQVQNSISMGDVSSGKSDASYLAVLMVAWKQNRRRVIAVLSVAAILAIVAITLSLTIDSTPAPAQAAVDPHSSSQPITVNTTEDPFEGKECVGNKLHCNKQLLHNQYICSNRNKYVFGLNAQGELLWGNDDSNFNHKIYTTNSENNTAHKFLLGQHGRFEILDEFNQTIWNIKSIYGNEITHMDSNPINNLSVPYLSMHNDGVVVLVYYNNTSDDLEEHNIQKIYPISN